MKSNLFLQGVLLLVLLSGCATLNEKFALSYDRPIAEAYWTERNPPTAPLNAAEALAVQSAAGLMTLKRVKGTAHYEGREGTFAVIRLEKRINGDETYASSVKYRIRNGFIFGETIPQVVAVLDPKKEAIAQEVAFEAVRGAVSDIPKIYDGRIFVAKNNVYNSCTVDVVERDLEREYTTYRIKTC